MKDARDTPMDRRTFAIARAAALEAIRKDARLSSTARLVASQIAEAHLNPRTRGAWPGNKAIAQAIGRCTRTVRRAKAELLATGHITIEKRGARQPDRILFTRIDVLASHETPQSLVGGRSCPDQGTDLSSSSGQNCPPNLLKNPRKKPCETDGLSFPFYKVHVGSREEMAWNEALREQSLGYLQDYALSRPDLGPDILVLPAPTPPPCTETEEWKRIGKFLCPRRR